MLLKSGGVVDVLSADQLRMELGSHDTMMNDFTNWRRIMKDNGMAKRNGGAPGSDLIELYDDGSAMLRLD